MTEMFPNNLTSGTSSSATASSYEGSYYPWQAFDGSNTTKWGPSDAPTTTYPAWLQRDLGKAYPIESVVVNFDSSVERWTQGSLQGSNDGSTFTELATYSGNTNTTLTLTPNDTTTPYRYIRLVGTGKYSGWGKITEMQIYVTAESNAGVRIQLRHDTSTSWSLVNPVLLEGEIGLETDTNKQKMGDGTTAWNSLPYMGSDVDQTFNGTSANAQSGIAINGAGFLKNTATGTGALTILGTATASANCVNIGTSSKATSYTQPGVAVGYNAKVDDTNGIAIGNTITASNCGDYGIGIGRNITLQRNSICVGYNANSSMENSICIGNSASVSVYSSSYTSYPSIALGYIADARWGSVAIGSVAKGYSENGVAIGNGAQSGYQNGSNRNTANIAIGRNAKCNTSGMADEYGTAIGSGAEVTGKAAIQLGFGSNTSANTFSVGFYGQNSNTPYTLLDGTTGLIPTARIPGSVSMSNFDSNDATTLTVPTSGTPMTNNLGDGWLYVAGQQTGNSGYCFLTVGNAQLVGQPPTVNNFEIRLVMPIPNGVTYQLDYSDMNIFYFAFYPAVGGV